MSDYARLYGHCVFRLLLLNALVDNFAFVIIGRMSSFTINKKAGVLK